MPNFFCKEGVDWNFLYYCRKGGKNWGTGPLIFSFFIIR